MLDGNQIFEYVKQLDSTKLNDKLIINGFSGSFNKTNANLFKGQTMKTNYSLKRIKELDKIITRLIYRERDKKCLSEKENIFFSKLFNCICKLQNKLPLVEVLRR